MARPEKIQVVDSITEKMKKARSVYVTDYAGLNVEQITELRNQLRKQSIEFEVVKNTLTKLSVQKIGYKELIPYLVGPTALAFSMDDPIAPARIIKDFNKKIEKPSIKALIIEGQFFDATKVDQLVRLPAREVLIGQVVSGIAAPLSGLVGALNGIISKLVFALNAIKEQKNQG